MADIKTKEKFDRVMQVMYTGRKHDGSKADREAVGDLTVMMYDPKNPAFPREIQVRHAEDMMRRKGYIVGDPPKASKPAKKQTKAQIEAERAELFKEAGGVPKGALKAKE